MRVEKAWVVARKEMAEFRSNKYIIFTLLFVPLLMALLLPLLLFGPILSTVPSGEPLDLDPLIEETIVGETLVDRVLVNASIEDSVVVNSVIRNSWVRNSNLTGVTVDGSILEGVRLEDSTVRRSNLINVTSLESTNLLDSALVGARNEEFITILLLVLDSFLLFFIMIPAAIPAVIASYTFVGEKVARSLEPLLATPTTDGELLLGKSLSIFLPTMGVTWLAAVLFIWLANTMLSPTLGFAPLPSVPWLVGVLLLAPLFGVLSITSNVIISSRVSDVRASQQLGTLVILPALFLFMGSIFGALSLQLTELLTFSLAILAVDLGVGYLALKTFRREEILVHWR